MTNEDLSQEAVLRLSIGHLMVAWHVLANKIEGTRFLEGLSPAEKRAIWALQDLCEQGLVENGVTARPAPEWDSLVEVARKHVMSIPVEFLHQPTEGKE